MAHILQRRDARTFQLLGAIRGVQNLTYSPRGASLGKSGQISFTIPMTLRKSLDLRLDDLIEVVDTTPGVGSVGYYLVDDRSETVAAGRRPPRCQSTSSTLPNRPLHSDNALAASLLRTSVTTYEDRPNF